jgi:hypothetical protein
VARDDYTKAQRDQWQAVRLAAERSRGQHASKIDALPRYNKATMDPFGKGGTLGKAVNAPISAAVKSKQNELDHLIASKMKKGQTLHGTGYDSSCFETISWKAYPGGDGQSGELTATFWRGGDLTYTFDLDRDSFVDMCSGSWGGYFNAEIR